MTAERQDAPTDEIVGDNAGRARTSEAAYHL